MILGERVWDISEFGLTDDLRDNLLCSFGSGVLGLASEELSGWLHSRLYHFREFRELGLALGDMEYE